MQGLLLIEDAVTEEYALHILNSLPADFVKNKSAETATRTSRQQDSMTERQASLQLHHFSPLPPHIDWISEDVIPDAWKAKHWQGQECEAAIIQRYNPGEGIRWHVDLLRFDDGVAILSLMSTVCMRFRKVANHGVVESVVLRPRSLLLCSGEARYDWEHCIEPKEADVVDGQQVPRSDRISITMRRVKDKVFI